VCWCGLNLLIFIEIPEILRFIVGPLPKFVCLFEVSLKVFEIFIVFLFVYASESIEVLLFFIPSYNITTTPPPPRKVITNIRRIEENRRK
jgi:hypothetical protein